MRKFYCNAKKDYCEKGICGSCKKYDGTGGNYIEVDENRKPTNFEKITESVENLAEFIDKATEHCANDMCQGCPLEEALNCTTDYLKEWLQKECE